MVLLAFFLLYAVSGSPAQWNQRKFRHWEPSQRNFSLPQWRKDRSPVKSEGDKVYGVNLGGWLVMEPWITPKLFETANEGVPRNDDNSYSIVDEYTWRAMPKGNNDRQQLLLDHWAEWVTEDILKTLAGAGINHLRVPIGYWYWHYPQDEPWMIDDNIFPTALQHLKTMVNDWAKPLGLKVLLDLHTAPGSQNGFDNSGRRGGINVLNGNNLDNWEEALTDIAVWSHENLDQEVLWGIEVLNEPAGFYDWMWNAINSDINPRGYQAVRKTFTQLNVVFETGFQSVSNQHDWKEPQYHNCWFDDHNYQCFGDDWNAAASTPGGWDRHLDHSCSMDYSNPPLFTVVGEFSLAVTDCTKYLSGGMNNGCDMASDPTCEYVGTPTNLGHPDTCDYYNRDVVDLPPDYKTFLKKYASAQMDAFEAANGWFFWNFRTENEHAPAWDYLVGIREGWMPSNAATRPRYCN